MKAKTFLLKLQKCIESAKGHVSDLKQKTCISAKFKSLRSDELEEAAKKYGPRIPFSVLSKIQGKSEGNLIEVSAEKTGTIVLKFWNHATLNLAPQKLKRVIFSAEKLSTFIKESPQYAEFEVRCCLKGGCTEQTKKEMSSCDVDDVVLNGDKMSIEVKLKTAVV